jgi:hypothetical protein
MLIAGKLQEVIDSGMPFTWAEAVAVVQQVIASYERERAGTSTPPRLENLWLAPDGTVLFEGCMPALTVGDAATLLDALLQHAQTMKLPGGLQYTLARATCQVDAPPLESIAALAKALSRQERAERTAILRDLYARTMNLAPGAVDPPPSPSVVSIKSRTAPSERTPTRVAGEAGGGGPLVTGCPVVPERRLSGPSVAELRRELRAADAELYAPVGDAGEETTLLPDMSELYDPVLARTDADTLRRVLKSPDLEMRRRHLLQWIAGAMTAVLIAFGVGYGATYEWRHRGAHYPRVQLFENGSQPAMSNAAIATAGTVKK